jgi:MFS family permease
MSMGQYMMNTLIPKYTDALGASPTVIGIVSSMFAITALLIRPVAGPAMDYFRKGRLLSAAIGLLILSFIGYGFARSIPVIVAARLLHGIGIGVAVPLGIALASNALPESKMASGISVYTLGSAIATAVGPSIGLRLSDLIGYNPTFFIIAALLVICLILCLRLQTGKPERTEKYRISLKSIIVPEVLKPTIVIFLITIAYSSINYFIVIFGGVRGVAHIGFFFTAYAVCLFVSRPICGRIADKYGYDKTIIPGFVLFAVSFLLISLSGALPMFIVSGAVCAFGYGICMPSLQALSMTLVPREKRGAAGNTNFIGIDCGNIIGPAFAGFIVTTTQAISGSEPFGYVLMYRVMIVPILIALAVFLISKSSILKPQKSDMQPGKDI